VVLEGFDLLKGHIGQHWDGLEGVGLLLDVVNKQSKALDGHDGDLGPDVFFDGIANLVDVVLAEVLHVLRSL
jgi:hypothetical protein